MGGCEVIGGRLYFQLASKSLDHQHNAPSEALRRRECGVVYSQDYQWNHSSKIGFIDKKYVYCLAALFLFLSEHTASKSRPVK